MYGNSDDKTFTLPRLTNFLKMNGTRQKSNGSEIGAVNGKNVLMQHTHTIDVMCDFNAYVKLRVPGNSLPGKGGTAHVGNGNINISSNSTKWVKYNGSKYAFSEFIKLISGTSGH